MTKTKIAGSTAPRSRLSKAANQIWRDKILYLMLAPTLIYFIIFRVWPILNMRLAFYDYKARGPWVWAGLKYFQLLFKSSAFTEILTNTLILSFMKYVLLFPAFVIFALLLNELKVQKFRKYVQVVSYLPHFLSWVVIAGIWKSFLSPADDSAINMVIGLFGQEAVDLLTDKGAIRWVLFFCEAWRSLGWDSIVFYTAIIGISADIYEAAALDGASRKDIIFNIILPELLIPMTTVFILNLGFFMSAGFDQVYNFTNASVNSVIDILDTYVNRVGIESGQYSLGTAVSLIKGLVGVILVYGTHITSKKLTGEGVW